SVEKCYWLLLPGGRLYFGLPAAGDWGRLDFDRAEREQPGLCGRYERTGDTIRFRYAGRPISFRAGQQIAPFPGQIRQGQAEPQTAFRRVAPCDGLRLEGNYEERNLIATSNGRTITGSTASERRFTFFRDGRFRYEEKVSTATS